MPSPHWSTAEREILRALALQVRFLSLDQVLCGWFESSSKQNALESMNALVDAGLVCKEVYEIHPPIPLDSPVLSWKPGEPKPSREEFENLASKLENRWTRRLASEEFFRVTPLGANLFASRAGDSIRDEECTHDFHLSELFIRRLKRWPETATHWLGEMAVMKLGFEIKRMKDPDAYLLGDDGKANRVIEFAGKYSAEHLSDLHDHCAFAGYSKAVDHGIEELVLYRSEGTAYELW